MTRELRLRRPDDWHLHLRDGAALRAVAAATATSAEQIFETKKIAENIVKVLKHRAVESAGAPRARQASVPVGIVNLALLLVAEHAVRFRAFAEEHVGFFFVLRIAVGMPFQRGFAIRRLDFIDLGGSGDTQHFVIVALLGFAHHSRVPVPVAMDLFNFFCAAIFSAVRG